MNILLFSTADWDNPFWTNKQHMTKTFEKYGHNIIYVDSLGIRTPTASKSDFFRIIRRFKSLFKPYRKISESIWVISPFVIPLYKYALIDKFNKFLLFFIIKLLMKYLKYKDFIIWTYSPVTNEIIDMFNAKLNVYHCVDDLSALPNVNKELIIRREESLISKSDFIFTTSENLYDNIKKINKNTYYQNNVCDYEHFSKAKKNLFKVPEDLIDIKGPKIVFVGAISSYKINFELLSTIASRNDNWNFLMIGQIGEGQPETNISLIEDCHNIHLLGAKSYDEIPKYLHFSDVGIIPSNLNDYTKSMFPMKFFEYLSAGLQVVVTELDALKNYDDICYISKSVDEFESNLSLILNSSHNKSKEKIETECLEHTWDSRYHKIMKIIGA